MLEYDRLSEDLVRIIPEIRVPYEAEVRWWGEEAPGAHIIFADILAPFLVAELQSGQRTELLRRVFGLLEDMASDPDTLVQEVAQQEVLSELCGDQPRSKKLKSFLGPRSRALMLEYCDGYHKH